MFIISCFSDTDHKCHIVLFLVLAIKCIKKQRERETFYMPHQPRLARTLLTEILLGNTWKAQDSHVSFAQ